MAQGFVDDTASIPTGAPNNASNSADVALIDIENDGDLDVFFAGGGSHSVETNEQSRLWVNQGGFQGGTVGSFVDRTNDLLPVVPGTTVRPIVGDMDGDGFADIYLANSSILLNQPSRIWINQTGRPGGTPGAFADESSLRWTGIAGPGSSIPSGFVHPEGFVSFAGAAALADLDGDGDLDLVHAAQGSVSAGSPTRLFLNDGAGFYAEFNPSGYQLGGSTLPNGAPGLWCQGIQSEGTTNSNGSSCDVTSDARSVKVADIDADGDLDILLGNLTGHPRLYQNRLVEEGSLAFRDVTASHLPALGSGALFRIDHEFADFDNDGDLDLYGLNWQSGFNLSDFTLRNTGTGLFEAPAAVPGSDADAEALAIFDIDLDGDLDAFVGTSNGLDRVFLNQSRGTGISFVNETTSWLPPLGSSNRRTGAAAGDLDGDGDLDLVVSTSSGSRNLYLRNIGAGPDVTPPVILSVTQPADVVAGSDPVLIQAEISDDSAPSSSQNLQATIQYSIDGVPQPDLPMTWASGTAFTATLPTGGKGLVDFQVLVFDPSMNFTVSSAVTFFVLCPCAGLVPTCCVELVFVIDTSNSMDKYIALLCNEIGDVVQSLEDRGAQVTYTILGINADTEPLPAGFACLAGDVGSQYGLGVPNRGSLVGCDSQPHGGAQGDLENWADATAIVADRHAWQVGCSRVVIPISDEASDCGSPNKSSDYDAVENAIVVSNNNNVTVFPLIVGSYTFVFHHAVRLGEGTGGEGIRVPRVAGAMSSTISNIVTQSCCLEAPDALRSWWSFDQFEAGFSYDLRGGHLAEAISFASGTPPLSTDGAVGGAARFDGSGGALQVVRPGFPGYEFGTGDFTIGAWLRPNSASGDQTLVDTRDGFAGDTVGYWAYLKNGRPALRIADQPGPTGFIELVAPQPLPLDTWSFVAFTVDRDDCSSGIEIYVDSVRQASASACAASGTLDDFGDLWIGGHPAIPGLTFDGSMDELVFLDEALSQTELCEIGGPGGLCKEIRCEGACFENHLNNGSFECGTGPACAQPGIGGLSGWFDGGTVATDWNGTVLNDCVPPATASYVPGADHGVRYTTVTVQGNSQSVTGHSELSGNLNAGLVQGRMYQLSFSALTDPDAHAAMEVWLGNTALEWSGSPWVWIDREPFGEWQRFSTSFVWNENFTPGVRFEPVSSSTRLIGETAIDAACITRLGWTVSEAVPVESNWDVAASPAVFDLGPGGVHGTTIGSPVDLPGPVGGSIRLDGAQDGVSIPTAPAIDPDLGPFTAALWANPQRPWSAADEPLMCKLDANGAGYALFLRDRRPTFLFTDGTTSRTVQANDRLLPGVWSHVVVTVERDQGENGVRLFVDGELRGEFDSSAVLGSLSNSEPLLMGTGVTEPGGATTWFAGGIDEPMYFGLSLDGDAIAALSNENGARRAKTACSLPSSVLFAPGEVQKTLTATITNRTGRDRTFAWQATGLPASGVAPREVAGPSSIAPAAGTVVVAAGGRAEVLIAIDVPSGLAPGLTASLEFIATDVESDESYSVRSVLHQSLEWQVVAPVGVIELDESEVRTVSFQITNLGSVSGVFDYRLETLFGEAIPTDQLVVVGAALQGTLNVPLGTTQTLDVPVRLDSDSRANTHSLLLSYEEGGEFEDATPAVFYRVWWPVASEAGVPIPFCHAGDAAPTCGECPCGNTPQPVAVGGCINSTGVGAVLLAGGVASSTADTLRFEAQQLPAGSFALLTSAVNALPNQGPCLPGSGIDPLIMDGLRCVGGQSVRHGVRASDTQGRIGIGNNGWGPPSGPPGGIIASSGFLAGGTRHFQAFYRDETTVGCGTGLNTTNGVTVTVAP